MEVTVCKTAQEDLKKMFFLFLIIFMSFFVNYKDTDSIYIAVFVQCISNIECFYDIFGGKFLHKKTKRLVVVILALSVCAVAFIMLYWCRGVAWMHKEWIKCIFVAICISPFVFWSRDFYLNFKEGK